MPPLLHGLDVYILPNCVSLFFTCMIPHVFFARHICFVLVFFLIYAITFEIVDICIMFRKCYVAGLNVSHFTAILFLYTTDSINTYTGEVCQYICHIKSVITAMPTCILQATVHHTVKCPQTNMAGILYIYNVLNCYCNLYITYRPHITEHITQKNQQFVTFNTLLPYMYQLQICPLNATYIPYMQIR